MAGSIGERLREAILKKGNRVFEARKELHEKERAAENLFRPVCQATEKIRKELESAPSYEFTINPTGVWITLFDREIRFSYSERLGVGDRRRPRGREAIRAPSEQSGCWWHTNCAATGLI
jgi:hypothetical protein